MKFRRILALSALLLCLIASSPALAAPIFTIPIDPIPFIPPSVTMDPCFGASVVTDMGSVTVYDTTSGTGFYTGVYTYDVSRSGAAVAHVVTDYKRVDFGSDSEVAMDDTFIDFADHLTIFGRSVNVDNTGIIGAHGIIVGAINYAGVKNNSLKGKYLTTDFGGSNRLCFFLETP